MVGGEQCLAREAEWESDKELVQETHQYGLGLGAPKVATSRSHHI